MTQLLIENVRALRPGQGVVGSTLLVKDGRIAAIDPPDQVQARTLRMDGGGRLLTPGLIDVHTHGIGRHLYEAGGDDLPAAAAMLPRYGVTTVLPTLYRVMDRPSLPKLRDLTSRLEHCGPVRVPGFHLEGPFLALPGAGAATVPGDVGLLDALLEATNGRVAAMSISPDTPNILPVIERLAAAGVKVFITHTRASVEQTVAAIDAGASHATHFYDVFPVPEATEPGARPVGTVEAILADDRVSVDFIADGVHVHPMAIRAALKAKGVGKVLLITDSNIGAGLAEGTYDTNWGFSVRVRPGDAARIHDPGSDRDGGLAGSALTMDVGMSHLLQWLDAWPSAEVWAMGSRSVAQRMGWADLGDLAVGAAADLVLWDRDETGRLRAVRTWIAGRLVHDAEHP